MALLIATLAVIFTSYHIIKFLKRENTTFKIFRDIFQCHDELSENTQSVFNIMSSLFQQGCRGGVNEWGSRFSH